MSAKKPKAKRARKHLKTVFVLVHIPDVTHDPYDNSIGGPNDYAYGM